MQFRTLAELALRVDELLLSPTNMAAARQLAETCLTDRVLGHVDAFQFPTDPGNPYDWTPDSVARETGEEEYSILTPGQIALVLAALHAVYCPAVEKVILLPGIELQPIDDEKIVVPAGFSHALRWLVIRDQVRNLGDYALPWFKLLLRRFERDFPEQIPLPIVQVDSLGKTQPAANQPPAQPSDALPQPQRAEGIQRPELEIDQESQAIALLFQHQDWSIAVIANYLKVNRTTLYKWDKFRVAAERTGRLKPRGPKPGELPRGHKTSDGSVEAYQDESEEK